MERELDHISVCICTYKRPQMLTNLLTKLQSQETKQMFTYSIVVADNDYAQSAYQTVESFKGKAKIDIDYYCEPEQNIALARNKAVANACGEFVAFIDDDEFPDQEWLLELYKTCKKFNASGVLGPVRPRFEAEPPQWIIKGKLCERRSFKSGTILKDPRDTRTGNVLFRRKILNDKEIVFDPRFGRTGGEDTDFFKRMIEKRKVFVWSNEACVYETIPPERLKGAYFLKRALLRGVVNSRDMSFVSISALKSVIAFVLYTSTLPVWLLLGYHVFMKYLIKDCDHIGKLLGLCGIEVINERT
jgi:succinoglycan biosynthesis protein ExoM